MSELYSKHAFELDQRTVTLLQYKGTRTIEIGPVNEAKTPIQPLSYSWSSADSVIAAAVGLGYLLTFIIVYCHFCQNKDMKCELTKCQVQFGKKGTSKKPISTAVADALVSFEDESSSESNREGTARAVLELLE